MNGLKFKAWHKKACIMSLIPEPYDDFSFRGEEEERLVNYCSISNAVYNDDIILIQSIGIKDKNGNDIFEGDFVRCCIDDEIDVLEVIYRGDEGYPAFDLYPTIDCDSNGISLFVTNGTIEIVGNIYENSELLER